MTVVSGLIIVMMGPAVLDVSVVGIVRRFTRALDATASIFASVDPTLKIISGGGGVRNKRNAKGKSSCFRVCMLKSISISPAAKKGSVTMWYCIGEKVLLPYQ